jgi:hypothetical protein
MSITYSSYVSDIAAITLISSTILVNGDNNFPVGILPAAIDYAEGRLYRDLDLPVVSVVDTSVTCSSGVRTISLSTVSGEPLVIERINLFSSAGTTSSNGTRVPLTPASLAVVDMIYPTALSSQCGQPEFFARINNTSLELGPTPDQPYGIEMEFTIRPSPLSATNSSTWLTQNVPELMIAASMVFMSGYMRDFGSQSDNPQMAQSWEAQYKALVASQGVDVQRMKFFSAAWTSQQPSPLATPPRA